MQTQVTKTDNNTVQIAVYGSIDATTYKENKTAAEHPVQEPCRHQNNAEDGTITAGAQHIFRSGCAKAKGEWYT